MSLLPNSKNRRLSNCMTKKRKCYLTVLTWILREPPMKITFQALVMQMTSCNKCIVQKSGHSLCKRREKILSIFPPKTLAQYVLPLIVLLASKRANTTFIYFKDLVLLATLFSKSVHTLGYLGNDRFQETWSNAIFSNWLVNYFDFYSQKWEMTA